MITNTEYDYNFLPEDKKPNAGWLVRVVVLAVIFWVVVFSQILKSC